VPGLNIEGVRLGEIEKNHPAYIAGLRNGDIVVQFNDVPVRTRSEFESRIARAHPDSTVKMVVMRGSERLDIPVKVGQND
jgi:S1-C subfamily serine protease